jgi:hypothetical protein
MAEMLRGLFHGEPVASFLLASQASIGQRVSFPDYIIRLRAVLLEF